MKIVTAEVHHLQIPMESGGPHGWGNEEWKALDFVLLELSSDAGLTGWGEGWAYESAPEVAAAVRNKVVPRLVDREITDVTAFTDELLRQGSEEDYGVTPAFAISAANIALWDLAGKAAGLPLHRLLGKANGDRFPVFASMFEFDDAEIVKKMCRRALSDNMCWLKLHEHQEDCIRAAREVAPNAVLVLDAFRAWTAEEAPEMAEMLRPYDLHWLEEPIEPPSDLEGLWPFTSAGIPIALGENAHTVEEFQIMIDAGAVAYLQPGITKMGGVEKVRQVIALGRATGVTVHPWQPHFGPALLAYLHVNATRETPLPVEFQYFESMAGRLYGDAVWPERGVLALPQSPGIGCDPDPGVLSEFAV